MTQIPSRRLCPDGLTLSQSMEDYVKTIYLMCRDEKVASTQAIADRLQVAPASVTRMLKRLADSKLVEYVPYRGVQLSPTGEQVALEVLRHHRLLELYLTQALGYSWDEVHDEAELLEHFISEKLEARICQFLGNPRFDPHGSPIPTLEGEMPENPDLTLALQELQRPHEVTRVCDGDPEILRTLEKLRLFPGVTVAVLGRPKGGSCHLRVGREEHLVAPDLCRCVWTRPTETMRVTADQMIPGDRAEVFRMRGGVGRRLEGLGIEPGRPLHRDAGGYHDESGPLQLVVEHARDLVVTLGN